MKVSWKRASLDSSTRLTAGRARHDQPRWIPENGWVVHRLAGDRGSGLILTDRRGRLLHPLVLGAGEFGPLAPLPGAEIGLFSYRDSAESPWRIRALPLTPTAPTTEPFEVGGEGVDLTDPAPLPGGQAFVYASDEGSPGTPHLWMLEPGRRQKRPLTSLADRADDQPAVSPSGRFLAFRGRNQDSADLYLLDRESEKVRRLTAAPGVSGEPAFLDEYRLVFSRRLPGGDQGLLLMDVLRGRERWLTGVLERARQPCPVPRKRGRFEVLFTADLPAGPGELPACDVHRARLEGVS
jgi:hypothetical protein